MSSRLAVFVGVLSVTVSSGAISGPGPLDAVPFLVKDINPSGSSSPNFLRAFNGRLFFNATDGVHGQELWVSDGTPLGTYMVIDLVPGPDGSAPLLLQPTDTTLFFLADPNGPDDFELFATDGTAAGTRSIHNFRPDDDEGAPPMVCSFRTYQHGAGLGKLFFQEWTNAEGAELWVSDGTAPGTFLLKDINPGTGWATPDFFRTVGPYMYFSAIDPVESAQAWRSDGTPGETIRLTSLPGIGSADYRDLNGLALFTRYTPDTGWELWRSDGTPQGTYMVKDIYPGSISGGPANLAVIDGYLYFRAVDPNVGDELWRSDGTEAGTQLYVDVRPGIFSSVPREITGVNGLILFSAGDGVHGREPWVTDGTPEGTLMLADINPTGDSFPISWTVANGAVYFTAESPEFAQFGKELYRTDGTPEGTVLIPEPRPGPDPTSPQNLTVIGDLLFFTGTDGVTGQELWALNTRWVAIPATPAWSLPVMAVVMLLAAAWLLRRRAHDRPTSTDTSFREATTCQDHE